MRLMEEAHSNSSSGGGVTGSPDSEDSEEAEDETADSSVSSSSFTAEAVANSDVSSRNRRAPARCDSTSAACGQRQQQQQAAKAAAAAAAASTSSLMSSSSQLQFMKLWGERRQQTLTAQPVTETPSMTFVPSSAWQGLPEEAVRDSQAVSAVVGVSARDAAGVEEQETPADPCEVARTDQLISDESAISVQSLCDAAAAAGATESGGKQRKSDDIGVGGSGVEEAASAGVGGSGSRQRDPTEVGTLLRNIRLGRRQLYAEDAYAVRLERDLRAELLAELDRQNRLDARLDDSRSRSGSSSSSTSPASDLAVSPPKATRSSGRAQSPQQRVEAPSTGVPLPSSTQIGQSQPENHQQQKQLEQSFKKSWQHATQSQSQMQPQQLPQKQPPQVQPQKPHQQLQQKQLQAQKQPQQSIPQPSPLQPTLQRPAPEQRPHQSHIKQRRKVEPKSENKSTEQKQKRRWPSIGGGAGGGGLSGLAARLKLRSSANSCESGALAVASAAETAAHQGKRVLGQRRRAITVKSISSSSNSDSDSENPSSSGSSGSSTEPQMNRCRWRKSRIGGANASNASRRLLSTAGKTSSPQAKSGGLAGKAVEKETDAEDAKRVSDEAAIDSNSSVPMKRAVYRASGSAAGRKRSSSSDQDGGGGGGKQKTSDFAADPDEEAHLDQIYRSVERQQPTGAVKILDMKNRVLQIDTAPIFEQENSEITSDSITFCPHVAPAPAAAGTATSGKASSISSSSRNSVRATPKTIDVDGSAAISSSPTKQQQQTHSNSKTKPPQQHQPFYSGNRSGTFHNGTKNNSDNDPSKKPDPPPRKSIKDWDKRGRIKSQILHTTPSVAHDKRSLFPQDVMGLDSEAHLRHSISFFTEVLPVDEEAKRIVAQKRSGSTSSRGSISREERFNSVGPSELRRASQGSEDSIAAAASDARNRRFLTGRHGRFSTTSLKSLGSRPSTSPSTPPAPPPPPTQSQPLLMPPPPEWDEPHDQTPSDGSHFNRNDSNRVGRLPPAPPQDRVREAKLVAVNITEPHLSSEDALDKAGCPAGVNGCSGAGSGVAITTLVRRRCRHVVMIEPQPVRWDLQMRRVVANPRPRLLLRDQQRLSASSSGNASNCAATGKPLKDHQERMQCLEAKGDGGEQQLQLPPHIVHWGHLGTLRHQKQTVARVRRVGGPKSVRHLRVRMVRSSYCFQRSVSRCTEIVDNPSLFDTSDSDRQSTRQRRMPLNGLSTCDADAISTVSTNTSSATADTADSCDENDPLRTVVSSPSSDQRGQTASLIVAAPKTDCSRRAAAKAELEEARPLKPDQLGQLSQQTYLYCTSATVDSGSATWLVAGRARQPRISYSHSVYYLPTVTVLRQRQSTRTESAPPSKSQQRLQQQLRLWRSVDAKGQPALTLLIACELTIVPDSKSQPAR